MASFLLPIIAACHIRASNALLNIVILLGRDVCVQPESVISTGGRWLQVTGCRLQVKGCRFQENSRNSPPGVQPRPTKRRAFASSGVLVLGAWLSSRNSPPGITTPAYKDVAVYCSRGRWPRGFFRTPPQRGRLQKGHAEPCPLCAAPACGGFLANFGGAVAPSQGDGGARVQKSEEATGPTAPRSASAATVRPCRALPAVRSTRLLPEL